MRPTGTKPRKGPESKLEGRFERMMRSKGWFVKKMHGSAFQSGFPDYYCTHVKYRARLVELKHKDRKGEPFTPAQLETFKLLSANGSPVWVIVDDTEEEYEKLFKPENWHHFLRIW